MASGTMFPITCMQTNLVEPPRIKITFDAQKSQRQKKESVKQHLNYILKVDIKHILYMKT